MVAVALIAGCSRSQRSAEDVSAGREAVADFRRASQQSFAECANLECLRGAATICAGAHLAERYKTIEGTAVAADTFVVVEGSKCSVVAFFDHTADHYGGCRLLKRTCSSLESMRSDSWDSKGCSQTVLRRIEPCTDQR